MKFTLVYEGPLKSASSGSRRRDEKHEIRRKFHSQLAVLWSQLPWRDSHAYHFRDKNNPIREVRGIKFAPLVSEKRHLTAALTMQLYSSDDKGALVVKTADIDNRLKVVFDALRAPTDTSELPDVISPDDTKDLFYTVLEDDVLVTSCDIQTDRLLRPASQDVLLIIEVNVCAVNFPIGGLRVKQG